MRRVGGLTIYEGLAEVPSGFGPSVVTIGVFDGVHRGHQALMHTVIEQARALDAMPVVVTFDRHPLAVIKPGAEPPLLTTLPQRARLMSDIGIAALVVLHFDEQLRAMEPDQFVRAVLVEALSTVHVVVGANFHFGHDQHGTIDVLASLGKDLGFDVTPFELHKSEQDIVSSSLIRRYLSEGSVERVAEELDRPFRLEGFVEHGAGRGKDLGVPTANLRTPDRMLLPKLGVYAGWMLRGDRRDPVVVNVGVNPTFGDRATPIVEAHVLGLNEDLYGQIVEIEFTHRLRDERKFDTVEALIEQMNIDIEQARTLLGV